MINISDSYTAEYIKKLKESTYLDSLTKTTKKYSDNYKEIINQTQPGLINRKESTNRLLSYYVTRLKQTDRVLTQLESTYNTSNLETNYEVFNSYVRTLSGLSSDMDNIAGTINYSLNFIIDRMRQLRREKKVLTKTIAKLSLIVDEYTSIDADLTTLKGAL